MADELVFDRDAVGVISSSNWSDSYRFDGVARGFNDPIFTTSTAFTGKLLEEAGISKLATNLGEFLTLSQNCAKELADAAASLGSGSASAIENFDEQEAMTVMQYTMMRLLIGQSVLGDD